ncbi:UNVERIFIED_ORG: HPt (histidine-containing phosphotransfer) domain-containing protein [Arthrobacter sp. UYEF10]
MDSPPLTSSSGGVPAEPLAAGSAADVRSGQPQAGVAPVRWVEPDILAELEEELDGPELALGFARDYASLWDLRFSRLAAAVHTEDRPAALDAVISLRIASAMVGGIRLSALAQGLEDAIRRNDFVHGQALLTILAEHGVRTVSELQASYILKND